MKGKFCVEYGSLNKNHQNYVYPNSKKKGEIILLDLNTFEEKIILLKEKCKVQTAMYLKNGDYLAINEKMDALKIG